MKKGASFVTTLVALASIPLFAQQSSPTTPPGSAASEQSAPSAASASPSAPTASPAVPTGPMSPISGELTSKLDSKTMKAGDNVTVQVKTAGKTADGTEIPKGSKLVGRVLGVKAAGAGDNSQVVLQFDHLELKGGQNLPIHSQIQSIGTAGSTASASGAPSAPSPAASPDASNSPSASGAAGGAQAQSGAGGAPAGAPAPGTVVAKTGMINISTTSVPGVLLANNAPGQQDPRMAQASSILLGAKQDIQLTDGTPMVVGVSTGGGGAQ